MEARTVAQSPRPEPPTSRPERVWSTPPRRLLTDKLARWVVTAGGLTIIASILGILLFILLEVAPLAGGAEVAPARELDVPPGAVLADEHRTHAAVLGDDGVVRVYRLDSGAIVTERRLLSDDGGGGAPTAVLAGRATGQPLFLLGTGDGRMIAQSVEWRVTFEGQQRRVAPVLPEALELTLDPARRPLRAIAARGDADGAFTAAAVLETGELAMVRRTAEQNFLTGETTTRDERLTAPVSVSVDRLALDGDQRNLYGANDAGNLLWWRLGDELDEPQLLDAPDGRITALSLLIGDRSLVVGHANGHVSIWFAVRDDDDVPRLRRIRGFAAQGAPIVALTPSLRDKGFVAADARGSLALYHSTSERVLWTGTSPVSPVVSLYFAPKADGVLLAGGGGLAELNVDNPHPEVSLKALFGRVWYESYEEPDLVWQSTGGSDEFEPKLSLTPLMVGTLKGTLYSLILAIPLGVLGAMYTSQFMHHNLKRYVKPTVEIMAALPSVVLGFLAGLWLAPRVEQSMPSLMLMCFVLPVFVVAAGFAWRWLPLTVRSRVPGGSEALLQMVVVAVGVLLCLKLGDAFAKLVFGGSFQDWLLETTGLTYDQRNAVVVGLAMGFAVIPIIFSIAEDAFSNVPRNLVSGSLALGANRWQTVTRVVLPSASPGIFSAIMIGFGRAVGETMIVLMATGNTPIMDWNPFNGFRTLSANIAVEIPEAPHGATLYRTLFLAALILFVFTFLTNTLAEVVRQRLRKRYAQL